MKVFWIILGLLAVVGVVIVFAPSGAPPAATPSNTTASGGPDAPQVPQPNAPDAIATPGRGLPETPGSDAPVASVPPAVPQPDAPVEKKIDQIARGDDASVTEPQTEPATGPVTESATETVVAGADGAEAAPAAADAHSASTRTADAAPSESVPAESAPAEAATADAAPAAVPPAPPAAAAPADGKEFEVKPSNIITREDGSLVADDRFVIKGKGTAAEPYEVTWEMLTSAEESYDPRIAKKQIPQRIAMLDGKKVRINGYVAFPMYVVQPRELLAMLNQWDGCCIGVPPTPYDAIEVRLARPVGDEARLATYGSVEGTFAIKPYVVGDWLIGLYMMENAELKPTQFGGFGS